MKLYIFTVVFSFILCTNVQAQQQFAEIDNLKLNSGQTITDCRVGYRTYGTLSDDSSNVILFPTWFEGVSEHIGRLITKYNFIDTTKYFIIAVDALGNSVSSSASNYTAGEVFPEITINDMVTSQYIMLTEKMGFKQIHGIVGGSMGGMQAFEWAVAYPEFAKKIVPYVGTPRLTSYDLMLMTIMTRIIDDSYRFNIPEEETVMTLDLIMNAHAYTPEYRVEKTSRQDFDSFINGFDKSGKDHFPLIDFQYQMDAMMQHNVARNFNDSMEEAAQNVKADMLIIPSMTDMLVNPIPAVEFAEIYGAEILKLQSYCGHISVNCKIEEVKKTIADFLQN